MNIITVAGIDTEVGKTVVSAILTEALQADYWKPVQCGTEPETDTETVKRLISSGASRCHPEAYLLPHPTSPHQAARLSKITLDPTVVSLPCTDTPLVIETAGGVMVPFVDNLLMLDLLSKWDSQWIVVSKNYLGSINHTLMTVEVLQKRGLSILGIIFNGSTNLDSEQFILRYTKLPCLARLPMEEKISTQTIQKYATLWKKKRILTI